MKFGAFQVALGLGLMAAPLVVGWPGVVFVWPGLAVLIVGIGYLGRGPAVFGKTARDGKLSPVALVVLWPYVLVAWTLWQLKSRLYDEAAWHEVAPGLRLGRRPRSAGEIPPGTRCVVDLTSELPRACPEVQVERYVCVPTLDTSVPADAELAALIDTLASEPGPMFVHCAMGHGRSATVAAALLIRRGLARDVDDAIAKLQAVRPRVHLHGVQRAALLRLAAGPATIVRDDSPEDRPDRAPRVA